MDPLFLEDDDEMAALTFLVMAMGAAETPPNERKDRNRNHERNFNGCLNQINADFFNYDAPSHLRLPEESFRKRFRMSKPLFLKIFNDLIVFDDYFVQKPDAVGKLGAHPEQKIMAALLVLTTGGSFEEMADGVYTRLSDTTIWHSLQHFCDGVIELYGEEYLRSPTQQDIERLEEMNSKRGFPGMFASIDE